MTPTVAALALRREQPDPPPARTCQWIESAGCFCGALSVPGRSWCAEHMRRVFVSRATGESA
jgi:hypothetical protein